jgi:hypothetical protein
MKKITLLLSAACLFSTFVMAQTKEIKKDETHLKTSIEDKKEDKHEAGKDLAHLKINSAINKRKEVRRHRKSIHMQAKHLESKGVKDPMVKAKHQAKADKELKKGRE